MNKPSEEEAFWQALVAAFERRGYQVIKILHRYDIVFGERARKSKSKRIHTRRMKWRAAK